MTTFLKEKDIQQSEFHPCLFFGKDIYLIFHVDDFLFVGTTPEMSSLLQDLFARFPGKRTDVDENDNPMASKKFLKLEHSQYRPAASPVVPTVESSIVEETSMQEDSNYGPKEGGDTGRMGRRRTVHHGDGI